MRRYTNDHTISDDICDICVIGDEQVGKTSLVVSYAYDHFVEGLDQTDDDVYVKEVRVNSNVGELSILDTASHKDNYTSSRRQQIMNTSGFLFTYSITDHDSFLAIEDLFERIYAMRDDMPPVVLVGLKSDSEDYRQVGYQEAVTLSDRIKAIDFVECSARTGYAVEQAFNALAKIIIAEKKSFISKTSDLTSLQSLREVLSSPVDSEQKTIPSTPEKLSSSCKTNTKFDADSMSIEIPKFGGSVLVSHGIHNDKATNSKADDAGSLKKEKGRRVHDTISRATTLEDGGERSRCCIIM